MSSVGVGATFTPLSAAVRLGEGSIPTHCPWRSRSRSPSGLRRLDRHTHTAERFRTALHSNLQVLVLRPPQDILVEYVRETVCAALSEAGRLGKLAERDRATGQPKLKV